MTTRRLYNIGISSRAQTRGEETSRQQLAQQGVLGSDTGSVTAIASDPDEEQLVAEFSGAYAEQMVAELSEIASAGAIDAVPYFGTSEETPTDAYYTISQARSGRRDPRFPEVEFFDGTLAKSGTIDSHRRAVETDISQVSHPFGNDETAYVGIPSTATHVNWYHPETGERDGATVVSTRSGEHGDVDVYDARQSTFYDADDEVFPEMIFRLSYAEEGKLDPRVWDTHGFDTKTDDEDVVRWQTVFAASHTFQGDAILENELVWLAFDQTAQTLTIQEWDDASSAWTDVALGTSDWSFFDLDVREIGLANVSAVVEFENTAASPTEYYELWLHLKRGWETPLWEERDGTGGTPNGLEALLDPIASASSYDPGESQGLRKRSDL